MSGYDLAGLVKVGVDILTTTVNKVTGKILAQTGSVTEQTTDGDNIEWWQHVGWASRPSKPEAGKKAAQGLTLSTGDHDVCIASQDVRCLDRYALLKAGESCAFAAGEDGLSQARSLWKSDGSITHFTTDTNRAGGNSVYSRVAKGTDDATGAPDGFTWAAPWGTVKFDSTGFHVVHLSGAELHLGGIYGMPSPLDQIASYLKVQVGTLHLNCSALSVGLGPTFPLANATAAQAAFTGLQAQLTALQAAIALFANPSTNALITAAAVDSGAALLAAATGGAAAGIAAVTAANIIMPTNASASL